MSEPARPPLPRARLVALGLSAGLLAGCGLIRTAAEAPGRAVGAVIPGQTNSAPSVDSVLTDLMRYADLINLRVDVASHQFEQAEGTSEATLQASEWRLKALHGSLQVAAGPNSVTGLLDLLVLASGSKWLLEDYWIPEVWGETARPMHVAFDEIERDGWKLVDRYLSADDAKAARKLLGDWRAKNPKITPETLLAFPNFMALAEKEETSGGGSSSLLGIVGLDPLSGLEPAARQIEQSRLLGLRALFFGQRASRLIAAEIEYRLLLMRDSKESRQLLADTERITTTLEAFQAAAEGLPAQLSAEREAALKQVSEELSAQRAGLVADLEASHEPLGDLLRHTESTLEAGKGMSAELTKTLETLDTFMGRFERPEGEPAPAPVAAGSDEPAGKPFDIEDYGAAAERVGVAARELTALVSALDQRLPEVQRLLDEAAQRGERTVDHTLLRLFQLGLGLIVVSTLARLLLRRTAGGAGRG